MLSWRANFAVPRHQAQLDDAVVCHAHGPSAQPPRVFFHQSENLTGRQVSVAPQEQEPDPEGPIAYHAGTHRAEHDIQKLRSRCTQPAVCYRLLLAATGCYWLHAPARQTPSNDDGHLLMSKLTNGAYSYTSL